MPSAVPVARSASANGFAIVRTTAPATTISAAIAGRWYCGGSDRSPAATPTTAGSSSGVPCTRRRVEDVEREQDQADRRSSDFPGPRSGSAKIEVTSRIPSSSRRLAPSRSGGGVASPRLRARRATSSGSASAPVSRSRVAPVRLAVTSSAAWMKAKRTSMTNSGSTASERDGSEDEASGEDRFACVRRPGQHECRADQAHPEADHRELHGKERTREVDGHPDDRAPGGDGNVAPPPRVRRPSWPLPSSSGTLHAQSGSLLAPSPLSPRAMVVST